MAQSSRKRKHAAVADSAGLPVAKKVASIAAYTKAVKPGLYEPVGKSDIALKSKSLPFAVSKIADKKTAGTKRKADSQDDECRKPGSNKTARVLANPSRNINALRSRQQTPTSDKPVKKAGKSLLPSTPTRGARSILEAFKLSSSPANNRGSSPLPAVPTPLSSPHVVSRPGLATKEVLDLYDLNAAFLTALSIHYAHNGIDSPVDLRDLRISVEKTWRKRKVQTADIRKVVALLNNKDNAPQKDEENTCQWPLAIVDYGTGKICLELEEANENALSRRMTFNIEGLKAKFEQHLEGLFSTWSGSAIPSVSILPLAPIKSSTSANKAKAIFAKGASRLEDIKSGMPTPERTAQSSSPSVPNVDSENALKPASSRSTSLLDRILAKQSAASLLPAGPTAEAIARRSALQRLDEVIPVVEMMSNSGDSLLGLGTGISSPIMTFNMSVLVQNVQTSLRNPISREHAEQCIRLMAEAVPGWVSVRQVGKVIGVTVRRVGRIGQNVWRARVAEMMEFS